MNLPDSELDPHSTYSVFNRMVSRVRKSHASMPVTWWRGTFHVGAALEAGPVR